MDKNKICFGKLDEVFPSGADGMRDVPVGCTVCGMKTACLRAALASEEGIQLRESRLASACGRGLMGRVRRWSELKTLANERDKIRKGTG
jgi:hypothetical protein